MSTDRSDPSLDYTIPFQITKKIHRDVPELLSPEDPKNSAKGRIVVVTGGGTGIGAAAARVWVQADAEGVVITGRRQNKIDSTAKELEQLSKGKTKILAVQADVTKAEDADKLFARVKEVFGRPADVVLANAGMVSEIMPPHKESISNWWKVYEINVLGTHNTAMSFIKSQANPDDPVGTFVSVNSGLASMVQPGMSAYSTAKLAIQRYVEYLHSEYQNLRSFSLYPGIVVTDMIDSTPTFYRYAKDKPEQTGATLLYLATPRAEYLRGSVTSINWDIEELEEHKDEIEKGLLKIHYIPIFPNAGGNGL